MNQLTAYTLRLGDNCLVLSQRLGEWCGHAPELEIDLALANIATQKSSYLKIMEQAGCKEGV